MMLVWKQLYFTKKVLAVRGYEHFQKSFGSSKFPKSARM